jgi:hypothetical protein
MEKTDTYYILWLASFNSIGLTFIQFYLANTWYLAYQRVKAPISGQLETTKFRFSGFSKAMNFFNSSFELNIANIVNWNKFKEKNVNWNKFCFYECSSNNYGYCLKAIIVVKNRKHIFSIIVFNNLSDFYIFSERPTIYNYEPRKLWIIKDGSSFFGVFIMSGKEFFFDSYDKRAWSVNSQSPEVEKLFYFLDERTRSFQGTERNERTSSLVLSSSIEWHPFQRIDGNGIPKRKNLLDSLTKFIIGYSDFKADGKIPGLMSDEVRVLFTVCNN